MYYVFNNIVHMLILVSSLCFGCGCSYVLGAVETFLKALPSAGIFTGND